MNYTESKQKLDEIRTKYMSAGDILFKTAIQYVIEQGQAMLSDEAWQEHFMFDVDRRHDEAEKEGKILFCTRRFEKAIFECAFELAEIKAYDLLIYVSREIYLGGEGIDYQRAVGLLKRCMEELADSDDYEYVLGLFEDMSFHYDELEQLGFGYLIEEEEE